MHVDTVFSVYVGKSLTRHKPSYVYLLQLCLFLATSLLD